MNLDRVAKWLDNVQFARSSKITFAIALIISLVAVLTVWHDPQIVAIGYKDTQTGPLGPSDRDMLYKVKQAGLWEMPVGMELASKSTSPVLRVIGAKISVEHMQLNLMTERVAGQLNVELPEEPTPDQKAWMTELSAMEADTQYDRQAVFYLRRAHGVVLPFLAQVKVGTRNEQIREFAAEAMVYVSRHIKYLEDSGLVDYSQLPEPPTPSPYQQPNVASYWDSRDMRTLVVSGIVILVLGALLAAIVVPMLRANPKAKPTGGKRRRK